MKKQYKIWVGILLAVVMLNVTTTEVYPKDKSEKAAKKAKKQKKKKLKKNKNTPVIMVDSVVTENISTEPVGGMMFGSSVETVDNLSDETMDKYDKYETLMKQKQFDSARETIQSIPQNLRSAKQKRT